MKYKTFNTKNIDTTKEPMFFGESVNVARFDKQKYPQFEKQIVKQMKQFWIPEEIAMNQDAANFHKHLDKAGQHIFTSNLKYQILLDSVQGRAPAVAMLPFVSLPELETLIETWSFFETIHSRSYTHIIRNIYSDPSEVLDGIVDIEEIAVRAKSVTKAYDDFIEYANYYNLLGYGTHTVNSKEIVIEEKELHVKLYRMVVAINILEGVRFYVSFACTWGFAEASRLMEKSAKIVKMICRDENVHLAVTSLMLKKFADGSEGPMMQQIAAEMEDEVYDMYRDAVDQEKEWADYLFQYGSIVGLNATILKDYVEFVANKRLKGIGFNNLYKQPHNPLPWTDHWISNKGDQPAPQEEEITSYLVGGIKNDLDDSDFQGFKL